MSVDYMTEEEVAALFTPDVLSGLGCGEGESGEREKESEAEGDVFRLTVDELPRAVSNQMMDDCEVRTWYVYHHGGRQYLCYKGFAWTYAYQPAYGEDGWRIDIKRLRKKDKGDVLLCLPDNGVVTVYCDGHEVHITDTVTVHART